MPVKKGLVTQTGVDVFTTSQIATGLTADGKGGWNITAIRAYWSTGESVAPADTEANLIVSTLPTLTTMDSVDEIVRVSWANSNTAGVAVSYPMELIKDVTVFDNGRLTVQPTLYVQLSTTNSAIANAVYFELEYQIIKLNDLEVLRLLQGGV